MQPRCGCVVHCVYIDAVCAGGDWGLARIGAITVEGAEGVSITGSTFTRLDGNAIVLSGYVRGATIDSNEFVWLGESAVVRAAAAAAATPS